MITELQARRLTNEQIKEAILHSAEKHGVNILHANYREYDMDLFMLTDNLKKSFSVVSDMNCILIGILDVNGNEVDDNDISSDIDGEECPVVRVTAEEQQYNDMCSERGGEDIL